MIDVCRFLFAECEPHSRCTHVMNDCDNWSPLLDLEASVSSVLSLDVVSGTLCVSETLSLPADVQV